jgi:peroxiredoxin
MPSVQRAHDALKDTDAVVLTLSLDGGGMEAVQAFLAKHGYTIPTLLDAKMEVARACGVRGIPATLMVDRDGAIVAQGHGAFDISRPDVRQYIQALLAQPRQ